MFDAQRCYPRVMPQNSLIINLRIDFSTTNQYPIIWRAMILQFLT